MYLRISNLAFASFLLAGCGTGSPVPEGAQVDCAIGAGAAYSRVCVLERVGVDEFVIHGPDGGFRRFIVTDDPSGQRLITVDGASEVTIINSGSDIDPMEFSVESDVYRIEQAAIAGTGNE